MVLTSSSVLWFAPSLLALLRLMGRVCNGSQRAGFWLRCSGVLMIMASFCGARVARAHTEQTAPTRVEIWPQSSFLMARIAGAGGDLNDVIHATYLPGDHEAGAALQPDLQMTNFAPEIAIGEVARERAGRYLGAHLVFKQSGVRLRGTLRALRMWRPDSENPSQTRFEALYRFERAPQLASAPLQVTSTLFSGLAGVSTVVDLSGEVQALDARQTASFAPELTVASASKNARDWAVLGWMHVFSAWQYPLFLLALALAATQRRARVVACALLAFTLAHAATFALSTLGVVQVAPQTASVGVALSIVAIGIFDWLQARAAAKSAQLSATQIAPRADGIFVALCAACGLIHGVAPAPTLRLIGLPESGLAAAFVAFIVAMLLAQLGAGALLLMGCKNLRARLDDGVQYGGIGWPRATQWAAGVIVIVAAFWTLEA